MINDTHTNPGPRTSASRKQNTQTDTRTNILGRTALTASLLLLFLTGVPAFGAAADASHPTPRHATAHVARTLTVKDTGHLHRVRQGGEYITEEGPATGTIPGRVKAYLETGAIVVAKFTIYTSVGTISGVGSGKPKGNPEEPSFAGTMTVSHGTGRYKHVHGHGGFYGTLNRSTYKMLVQTTGTLSY